MYLQLNSQQFTGSMETLMIKRDRRAVVSLTHIRSCPPLTRQNFYKGSEKGFCNKIGL